MGCKCTKDLTPVLAKHKVGADVREVYRIGKLLGSGAFGQVRECMHRETKAVYAMKIMEKASTEKGHWSNENMFLREVQVLEMLDHPNIVRYHAFFEDTRYLYAVMEKCAGGELFESILKVGSFTEKRASFLCYQMLNALSYVHSVGVIHRDIKAENYLFVTADSDSPLKLIDFGMSARLNKGQMLTDVCGSPHYLSPELIRRRYSFKADVWALGVLVYLMIFGRYPFDGQNTNAIVKMILTKKIEWHHNETRPSEKAIHFIKMLLQRNPDKRPTAAEAAQHSWLATARRFYQCDQDPCLSARMLDADVSSSSTMTSGHGGGMLEVKGTNDMIVEEARQHKRV